MPKNAATQDNSKNALPLQQHKKHLRHLWTIWLIFRLIVMSGAVIWVSNATFITAIAWQIYVLIPAFLLTPFILKTKNAYALIVASLVLMIYWAVSVTNLLIKYYEKAPSLLIACYVVEGILLSILFYKLFITTKKMPAMHKNP